MPTDRRPVPPTWPPEARSRYLPERHKGFLTAIYERLGVTLIGNDAACAPEGETLFHVSVDSIRSLSEIHVTRLGADFGDALKKELRRVRHDETRVVELYLALHDPAAPTCVAEAEKLGFFVTALLPEALGGDALVMQYMNGVQVEYDDLVIDREETRQLLGYIATLDPSNC